MAGQWRTEEVGGKVADVFAPGSGRRRFGLLYLHPVGLESLADNPTYTRLLDAMEFACIAPRGMRSWWADRVCPEFDPTVTAERYVLDAVVPAFATIFGLSPPAIGVMGISMGGQGAIRLAFKHPRTFPVVAGVASAFEYHAWYGRGTPLDEMYDSKEQARQDTAILHVVPHAYPPHLYFACDIADREWWRGNDRLHEKLDALGIPHVADLSTRAGGHSWAYFDAMAEPALRFVERGLTEMARRLL